MIAAVGPKLDRASEEIDGRGRLLLPGLHDHHLHILAQAARRQSVDLAGLTGTDEVANRLRTSPGNGWIRAVGYDERAAGIPDAALLDRWVEHRPVRLADRTGALRVLNSLALKQLQGLALPPGAERNAAGQPTGRFWREDRWLAQALPQTLPDLEAEGRSLAALGVTALTDATAHNGPEEARILADAVPQRLTLMGSEALVVGVGYRLGPLKLDLDERDLPAVDELAHRIAAARASSRAVAAHCVTEAELAIYLASLEAAGGARPCDRIEHGGLIPAAFVPVIADMGLQVVTNPAFIHDRGDRYAATINPEVWEELYPAAGLLHAGIAMLAGSDAPYASADPWLAMRAACVRRTAGGLVLGPGQRINAITALRLYCSEDITPGKAADLILCEGTLSEVLTDLSAERLQLTMIAGETAFRRD
jgi:predicted amidohydrolase YtcJ